MSNRPADGAASPLTARMRENAERVAAAEPMSMIGVLWSSLRAVERERGQAEEHHQREMAELHAGLLARHAEELAAKDREIARLRNPTDREREVDRFIRDVPPTVVCECGHEAQEHDVRVAPGGDYERHCCLSACPCDDFAARALSPGAATTESEGTHG